MSDTTSYITIGEAAKRYGVDPNTIRRRVADGTITAFRIGPKLLRIDEAQLDALLRQVPTARASATPRPRLTLRSQPSSPGVPPTSSARGGWQMAWSSFSSSPASRQ